MTKIIWINRQGQRREHSMGFMCTLSYARDWFRRNILECQGELSVDEKRNTQLRLLEVIDAKGTIIHPAFKPCEWPSDPDHAKKCDCYEMPIRGGKIYLQANTPHFSFTVSCGANSDRSYSGCFYGHNDITTAEQAMNELVRMRDNDKRDEWK